MGIGSILTGLGIYKPVQLGWLCEIFGGYKMTRIIHFALTIGYVLFFVIHIIQVIIAGWNNFQAMITGFEVIKIKKRFLFPKLYRYLLQRFRQHLFRRYQRIRILNL